MLAVLASVTVCAGLFAAITLLEARYRARVDGAMRQMSAAFELYAGASVGNYYPLRSVEPDNYLPDRAAWAEVGDGKTEFEEAYKLFTGDDERTLCYLGYAFYDEASAHRVLDQLEREPQAHRGGGTFLGEEPFLDPHSPEFEKLHPLREGVGRRLMLGWFAFHGLPARDWEMAEAIPILWQMPKAKGDRVPVLRMGGVVRFEEYPGGFPMSPLFINRLRALMGLPQDPDFSLDTPILPIVREMLEAGSREPGRGVGSLRHFDAKPTVSSGNAKGYRIALTHAELVLFPEETETGAIAASTLFEETKGTYYGLPRENAIRYMGASRGYQWYGKMDYGAHVLLREAFDLTGGDSLYDAAVSYWIVQEPTWVWLRPHTKAPGKPAAIRQNPNSLADYVHAFITSRKSNRNPVRQEFIHAAAVLCGSEREGYGVYTSPTPELVAEARERLIAAAERDPEAAVTLVLPYVLRYRVRSPRSGATPDKIEILQRLPRDAVLSTVRHLAENLQDAHEAALCQDLLEKLDRK